MKKAPDHDTHYNLVAPCWNRRACPHQGNWDARFSAQASRAANFLSRPDGELRNQNRTRWNAPRGGGYVTRFQVRADFMESYEVQNAGGREHQEYWIPAEDLPDFNAAIFGEIEVTAEFTQSNI
jgi:hypothetical protein